MKATFAIETAEIEYSAEQLEKIISFFSATPKKKKKMSGQLPTLNKSKHSNANKRKKSFKAR